MKDKIKVLKTYRDCTGKNAIYLTFKYHIRVHFLILISYFTPQI